MKLPIRERLIIVFTISLLLAGSLMYGRDRVVKATAKLASVTNILPVNLKQFTADPEVTGFSKENFFISEGTAEMSAVQMGCATPSFAPAPTSPESTGLDPHYICPGYFNADSHLDIAVTNEDENTLSILLGDGTGNFTEVPGPRAPTGVDPITVEDGDFNGDGKADLAVANQGSSSVNIFLGNGDGTFTEAPGSPITVGAFPRAVAVGNFNGDSNQDLVVSNGGVSNDVSILLGNGDGTFTNAPGSPFFTGGAPFHTVIGNFNGDAHSDLAIALFSDGTVKIYLGNGNGTFTQSGSAISVGTFTSFIALGDYNEDTHQDLAVVSRVTNNMVILLGNGSGGFAQAPGSPYSTGTAPMAVATEDLNFDGHLDLAVSNENSANTFVYLGNGDGTFGSPTALLKGQLPTHVAIADFNNDNRPDIATSDGGDHTVTILLNTCTACAPITVNPATIASGTAGVAYSETFTVSGGIGPYTFNLTGTLPTGMSFSGDTLSGTPTQTGSFPITVSVTDANSCPGSRNYTLVVNCQSITVNPTTIATGTAGTAYSETFTQTGGIGTTIFSLTGTLPTGMSFSGATLSGTPTQTGSFPITVTATDSNGCTGSRNYTLVVNCQSITVNPTTIAAGTAGTAYSETFTQTGGIGTTIFSLTGTLPTGMSFAGATLSGTPTQTGSFPITVTATDSNGCTGNRNYTLVINCQSITVNPTTIAAGTAGTAYSETFTQTGGIGTTTFSLMGTLPNGMSFSGATLSGTPTQTGSFPITVTATDSNGCTGSRGYTLVINCQAITVNPPTIATGTAGTAYSETFTHSGGIGTTTFSLTGTLPTGMSFSGATLSGTPTQTGSFPITVTATDSNGCTGNRNYTLVINCQSITVNPATISNGTAGTAYTQTFTQTGGIGTTTFSLTGTLPNGLSFSGATLSGTPTQTGSFPITVMATDSNGCTGNRNYTLVINCQTITVNPSTISIGTIGVAYSETFAHAGGIGTVNFGLTGTLPNGLSFSGATLSGTPLQTGSFPITVTATDSNGCTGNRNYTLVINCQTIVVNPTTISSGTIGTAYSQTFTQTGGGGTVNFSLTGTLPTGLSFSGATLSGTPTQTGSFPITVTATDSGNCTGSRNYTLVINCQTYSVTPATIPAGTVGTAYSQTFAHSGGVGTVTFSQLGKLPTGITFSGATLSGTPTQTGSFPISITATDVNGCTATRNYTLVINCQSITVSPTTIATGTVNVVYNQSFMQTGGVGTTNFSVTGTLPTGLSFSGATLSGTPTQSGSFPITVTATDSNGCTGSRNYTLVINCQAITVNPATIPAGTVNSAYSQTFTQTGGVGTVNFSLTGALPTGLSFASGTLSGTPTQSGSFPITVTATDSNNCTGSRNYTLVINCQTISVLPATIPVGTAGTAYSQSFTSSGGVGTVTFSQNGKLPAGLTFSGATLSGTPTQTGTYPISITATDANNCSSTRNYTLVINCQSITVNPATIPSGTTGAVYSQTFTQLGGIGTTTFALTGTLPTGLTFSGATLSGTPTQSGNFPITVTATDSNGCTGSRNYTLVICATITVNPSAIPSGAVGSPYSQTFTQTGGAGSVTFGLTGTLPTGLSFSGATLSGTPSQAGSFPITVTATDSNGCMGSRNYILIVCASITVNPATIPTGTTGTLYSQTFTQTGGVGTTTFSLTGGLPTGLTFSGATLSGTPTQSGSFPITVTATDSNGCIGSRGYTLVINCQSITVNPATIPSGTTGAVYGQTFTQTGGIGTTTFALTGALPTGLTFSGATLSGTPTQSGSFPITVTATDANGCTGSRNYTLIICASITVNPSAIPGGAVGSPYSQTFTQVGGAGSVSFGLTGTLPTGLTFSGATLSGTPTQSGSFPITVTATDSNGCMGSRNYILIICASITVNPATIPAGTAGSTYSQTFTQTGGAGTVTFSRTGTLPTGMTFTGATLSGTPTQTGSFPITITATDSNGCTGSRNYTLVINCQAITVNPATIPSGSVGVAYSQGFTQTGGIGTTNFSITGTLPTGLSFAGATLSGTPTQSGSFPITVTATDSNGCTGSRNYTLIINCQSLTVNPATIPTGTVNTSYSQTFTQTGGTGTVTFSLIGALPTGLSFSGATLSGTPTQSGSFPITVTATDSNNCTGSRNYTLVINCQTISVLPATIPAGTAGTAYSQSFTSSGGVGTVTFSQNGKLPAGLTFSGATLSGTPTQTGTYPISITATDANNCSSTRNYTLVINCQSIMVNPATISAGTAGTAYSQTFTQVGGIGTTTFSLSGALPTGLTFAGAALSGTPTQTGNFPITVTATDANGCTGSRNYTLVVNCQTITVNPASIPAGTANSAYSQTFTQSGGTGSVNFNLTGALPAGMSFAGATLSGTPTQTGSFPITVTATDANGCTGSRNYTLLVNCQGFTINPASLPAGMLGEAYNQTLTQTGGVGAVTYSLTGTLPNGITFAGATFSGTPTQPGSFPITVTAIDSNSCTTSRNYTLVINCQTITVNPATIPAGTAGTAYSQGFTQTGGVGTTTFSLTGTLPTGMTFSGASLSGTPLQTGSFPITVTATDSNGCTGSRNYTLVINCQAITVNPATIPAGTANTLYSQGFTQSGGIGTTVFSLTGKLPTGLTFSGATLSGTPTQTGNFPITVTATDANGCTGSRSYTLVINCPAITVNPATLPNGFVGSSYGTQTLSATGGVGSYTFNVSGGSLPNGITLSGAALSGTPTATGTFNFTLQATDSNGCTGTRSYTVIISGGNGGLQFYPLAAPVRLVDTRTGEPACFTPGTAIAGGTSLTQLARGTCGIPASARAVTGNVTVVTPPAGGFLTIYPGDAARPLVANTNYAAGDILNNVFTVGLADTDGTMKIFVQTTTHIVMDITGYYAPPATAGLYFHPLPKPIRLLETRPSEPGCFTPGAPIAGNTELTQQGTGTCSDVTIPASALALVGNATTVNPVGAGFLTFFPANATRPLIASGNYDAGEILNSPFTAGLSPTGQFKIYTLATTHLVVDVLGYFSPDAVDVNGTGLLFNPITPVRLLETRTGEPGCTNPGAPLAAGVETPQTAQNFCSIAATAKAIVGNATVVQPGSGGFLTFWPSDATRPLVATSNYLSGDILNRHFTVGLGANGQFKIFPSSTTHLVIDVSGYFAP